MISKIGYTGTDIQSNGVLRLNSVQGKFKEASPAGVYNGFTFGNLSKTHTVVEVDSIDSFIIQIASETASSSGRFGGEDATINMNEKYEMFNVSGDYLPYDSTERWVYQGIGHNPPGGPFTSQDYQTTKEKDVIIGNDMFLDEPHKMVSSINNIGGTLGVTITGLFSTPSEWVSPVVNTDSFSMTTVSNRVEFTTLAQLEIEPNATGRFKGESDPMNGSENYKYVTKTINLANPASDLVIAFDIFKDINSDYDVWLKVKAPYDSEDIDSKRWMRISGLNKTRHSADLTDRVEYEITMSNMQVEVYTTDTAFTLLEWEAVVEEFSSFKIKLVGKARNPAIPPLFQSFRAIAIT
jgi:hypothetical protein